MKKDEKKIQEDFDEFGDVTGWDWDEEGSQGCSNNARTGGCVAVLFVIALVWFGVYELIKWLF